MSPGLDKKHGPVGILGGTFDPVHYGHLRAAVEVRERLGLTAVRMLPSARPPHRQTPGAEAEHRMQMLQRAIACQDYLEADDSEIRREGPSYMVDTLDGLRQQAGHAPLVLIVGQDAANQLDRWHEWRRLFELAHVAVMQRPETAPQYTTGLAAWMAGRTVTAASDLLEARAGKVINVTITQLDISSSAIRELVAGGRSPLYLTPPPVIEYIKEHGLYSAMPTA